MSGRVALVGSGEFTPATEMVDLDLLAGRGGRVVFLPTAASLEGAERIGYWVELGRAHYRRLGLEAMPLMVLDRDDADDERLAAAVAGAGLVYLSGGDPSHLASVLVGSRVGDAILSAWHQGTAVAGCSAGAMALMDEVPDIRQRRDDALPGLGVVTGMRVIPHFDRIERWMPGAVQRSIDRTPPSTRLVGIDEDTAIVGGPLEFRVMGRGCAWSLSATGPPTRHQGGAVVTLADPSVG